MSSVEKPAASAPAGQPCCRCPLRLLFLACCVRSHRAGLFTEACSVRCLVPHCITCLQNEVTTELKSVCGPKVIFLSFTFLCLLLSLHPLMYLVLPLPPHSLLLLSPSSRLSAGLARHTFRYSCLYSPSLTSDSYTAHTALTWLLLSYQLFQVLLSVLELNPVKRRKPHQYETEEHFANICLSAGSSGTKPV